MGNDLLTSLRQSGKKEIENLLKWKDAKRWILERIDGLDSLEEIMLPAPHTARPPPIKLLRVLAFNNARDYLHKSLTDANGMIEVYTKEIPILMDLIRKVESKLNNPHFRR